VSRNISAHRLAAARRAVKREAESVALFPELRRFTTPEERIEQADKAAAEYCARLDAARAEMEDKAIRRFLTLPDAIQEQVAERWMRKIYPDDIYYFADLMFTAQREAEHA